MVSPLRMSVISQGPPALWIKKGGRRVWAGPTACPACCPRPRTQGSGHWSGSSGSELSGSPDVKSQCLNSHVRGSPHVGEEGSPSPGLGSQAPTAQGGDVLTWAPSAAAPECPAHSTAGLRGVPQCRRQRSGTRDKMPQCVNGYSSHPSRRSATRLCQCHFK